MIKIIARWFLSALGILAAAQLVPGIEVSSFYTALILSILWGLLNAFIRPLIILLTLPISILTLGLFTFVINGFLFWFLSTVVKGFAVSGLISAIIGAIVVSLFSWLANYILKDN